ncbi:MAG: addiction module toxin RelE [Nanoarchaeota archaeon]|nr:addiction module toxin RelE [Nanoarchaeota archaeon]
MNYEIRPHLQKVPNKLSKKDKILYGQVLNKIGEVANSDPEHYKNLRYDLKDSKRVHVGSFVLVFQFDKKNNKIIKDNFDHHDKIYVKR